MEVREVRCKTILHRLDYGGGRGLTANFYKGCAHACVYCYVPSLIHDERQWGTYVDVKVNASAVLARELRDFDPQVVFLSSATDHIRPWKLGTESRGDFLAFWAIGASQSQF